MAERIRKWRVVVSRSLIMAQKTPQRLMSVAFLALLGVGVGCVGAYWYVSQKNIDKETGEHKTHSAEALGRSLKFEYTDRKLNASKFKDADGDLIADCPTDVTKQMDPAVLTFSYIGGDPTGTAEKWKDLAAHLEKITERKVEYLPAANVDTQLWQMNQGQLHITVLNSGAVPLAVNECGFVPIFTMGESGYKMQIIVPVESGLRKVEDLRGKRLTLVDHKSNSGYKVPVLELQNHGLKQDQDYEIQLSYGQTNSIKGIASREYAAAAVASDLLAREEAAGTIKKDDYRIIFESSVEYPQAAAGYVYNLKPELALKICQGLGTFDFSKSAGTGEFTDKGKFVPTNYKEKWLKIRDVTNAFGIGYEISAPAAKLPAAPMHETPKEGANKENASTPAGGKEPLILVRPKIIIQREEEVRRFGVDYDKPANLPRLQGGASSMPSDFSHVPPVGAGH